MSAVSFARPILLWLALAAPLAAALAAWLWRRRHEETARWAARALWDRLLPGLTRRRLALSVGALALSLAALAAALAGPRWGETLQTVERRGIDVVFVLDTSLSMAARDVAPSRFIVGQALIRRLAASMPEHRIALVEFEGDPVVMTPLTTDVAVLDLLLDTVEPGALPQPGSRIGPALAAAVELFPPGEKKHRAIVVVSDGEDHEGGLGPALVRLREEGVVVNAIAIGSRAGAPLPLPGGTKNELKRDRDGQVVISRLEPRLLERLTQETGGVYLAVHQASVDPAPILQRIAAIEDRSIDSIGSLTRVERFQWPLALAAALLLLHLAVPPFRAEPGARHGNGDPR